MIDVNFGNKTIIAGLAMALILAYGMVNFDSGTPNTDFAFPKAQAVSHETPQNQPANQEVTQTAAATTTQVEASLDAEALPALQKEAVVMSRVEKAREKMERKTR